MAKRAQICNIVTTSSAKSFYIMANKYDWKKREPERINKESPTLFMQLIFRAICENEITIQKGAELLKKSYSEVEQQCFYNRG